MKILLPVGALLLIGLIFLAGRGREVVADAKTAANVAALGVGMRLENPRFAGITDQGHPFLITAKSAVPDGARPDRIELDTPSGELRLAGGQSVTVQSKSGMFFRKDEKLDLSGQVILETSDGYRVETESIDMNLATREATSASSVTATGPRGSLRADRAEVTTNEDGADAVLRFDGNVRLTFLPAQEN